MKICSRCQKKEPKVIKFRLDNYASPGEAHKASEIYANGLMAEHGYTKYVLKTSTARFMRTRWDAFYEIVLVDE